MIVELIGEEQSIPHGDKCVVTLVTGENYDRLWDITGKRIARYAEQCGADLVVLNGDRFPRYPMYNKFRLQNVFANYLQSLYVDVDVLIKKDAPNIFDVVPIGCAAAMDELQTFNYAQTGLVSYEEIKPRLEKLIASQYYDYAYPGFPSRAFNGGVIVIPQSHAHLYKTPTHPLTEPNPCVDQDLFTLRMSCYDDLRFIPLSWRWNCFYCMPHRDDSFDAAYFIHPCPLGLACKLQLLADLDKHYD